MAHSGDSDEFEIRLVDTLDEYRACVQLQEEIWGPGFLETVPPAILMIAQKMAGVCAGAFTPNGALRGFVFGMSGLRFGRLAHWSDMLAVDPAARGANLGERLKAFQRDVCLAHGIPLMYWTFDPLVARNAHLNLHRLGARASEYAVNLYGSNTGSPLHGALDTDRWIAEWDLTAAPAPPAAGASEPVTVVVTRRVKPGREHDYEAWLERLLREASALPGYLGTTVHRPPPTGSREYTSVFRFDTIEHLRGFIQSELRRRALVEVGDLVEADAAWQQLTGLEFWFTAPPGTVIPQPSRPRMALLMIVVVYALVLSIGSVVGLVLRDVPSPLRLLVTIVIEVALTRGC